MGFTRRAIGAGSLALPAAFAASAASASGYALNEHSAAGLGVSYAGAAAAEDASAIWFNPAGMAFAPDQLLAAGHLIAPRAEYRDRGSTAAIGGAPLTGGDGGDGGVLAAVPALFASRSVGEGVKLGLGITAPYGLSTEWDGDWVGRYHATLSELTTINVNPTVSFRPEPWVAFAIGANVQYAKATLGSAIDFGTIGAGSLGSTPQTLDGSVEVEGDDFSYGWNIGVLAEPIPGARIGASYRSKIVHDLRGEADFTVPAGAAALTAGGAFVDTSANAQAISPETASISASVELDEQWTVMGDVTWTNWRDVEELRIRFASPQPDSVTELDWDHSMRFSGGVAYDVDERLRLRAGVAFDQTPVRSNDRRTPRVPDADRYWLSVGAGWRFDERLAVDVGYAHLFIDDAGIELTDEPTRGNLIGVVDGSVDILGAQLTWRF